MAAISWGETLWPPRVDHVVGAAGHRQAAVGADTAQVRGGEPAVFFEGQLGQVGAVAVAGEQHGAVDLDPAVGGRAQLDAVQGNVVVDAAAAGLRHAVRGDHLGARGAGRRPAGRTGSPRRRAGSRRTPTGPRPRPACGAVAPGPGRCNRSRTRPGCAAPGPGRSTTTGVVPETRERTSMPSPAMWLVGSGQSQRMPGAAPIRSRLARAEARNASALSWTPLGSPVEPDVAITTAVPSGRSSPAPGAAGRASSGRHRMAPSCVSTVAGVKACSRSVTRQAAGRGQAGGSRDRCRPAPPPARQAGGPLRRRAGAGGRARDVRPST